MLVLNPQASFVKETPRVGSRILPQGALVADIVVDDPFPPKGCGCIRIEPQPRPTASRRQTSRRSRIKADPTRSGEVSLNPGMGVTGSHHVLAGEVVELTPVEPCHNSRRDAQRAQHYRHRTGEILAVTCLPLEQEIGQWILRQSPGQLQRVSEVGR